MVSYEGIEIDFRTNRFLMEVKYNSVMTTKQKQMFEKIPAKKKIVVDSIDTFLKLREIL